MNTEARQCFIGKVVNGIEVLRNLFFEIENLHANWQDFTSLALKELLSIKVLFSLETPPEYHADLLAIGSLHYRQT